MPTLGSYVGTYSISTSRDGVPSFNWEGLSERTLMSVP